MAIRLDNVSRLEHAKITVGFLFAARPLSYAVFFKSCFHSLFRAVTLSIKESILYPRPIEFKLTIFLLLKESRLNGIRVARNGYKDQ